MNGIFVFKVDMLRSIESSILIYFNLLLKVPGYKINRNFYTKKTKLIIKN